ncbi:MAG: SDR family NAD(P)-dependent oxidoreductase [Alphaproteobacteria bacterium]|nr:SDR family NAD(P)-dependent oxidoreductase [Alphaproteobacteria bacterium]
MGQLDGKVFILTGGAGAVAGFIAEALVGAGARLALADLDRPRLHERAAELGALAAPANVLDPAGGEALLTEVTEKLGPVDGLVCTVGGFSMGPLAEAGVQDYDKLFNLNVKSFLVCAWAALPGMIARGGGFIGAIGAGPGLSRSAPHMSLYGASKAALTTLVRSLDEEAGAQGVNAFVLHPMGAIDTPGNRAAMPDVDPQTWIDPAELAAAMLFAATRSARGRVRELALYPPA